MLVAADEGVVTERVERDAEAVVGDMAEGVEVEGVMAEGGALEGIVEALEGRPDVVPVLDGAVCVVVRDCCVCVVWLLCSVPCTVEPMAEVEPGITAMAPLPRVGMPRCGIVMPNPHKPSGLIVPVLRST